MVSFSQSMKRFRFLAVAAAALVGLVLLAAVVAFNSTFQTWMARRALADQPGARATVGRVSAGLREVRLTDLRIERGGAILILPVVDAELPLISAGLRDRVHLTRLVAKNWTLDLSQATPTSPVSPEAVPPAAPAGAPPAAQEAAQAFTGVFSQLELPVDLSVDGVELEGEVVLPASRGRVKVTLRGGGLGAGREGQFDLTADATLSDPAVSSVGVRSTLAARMETPRSIVRLAARIDAEAKGTSFPQGVKLTTDLAASRASAGESYSAAIVTPERVLLRVQAEFPHGAQRLDGSWKIDVRSNDVAPFAFGKPLPDFAATGEGKFDADARFTALHAAGRLDGTADRLAVLAPALAGLEALKYGAEFDVARQGTLLTVDKLVADIAAAAPVARVQALQRFEFNPATAELKAADPARDLLAISLLSVPVAWARPFFQDIAVAGGEVRGELVATPRAGGVALRSTAPVSVSALSATRGGAPLARDLALSLELSADYAPRGWQAEIGRLLVKGGEATLLTVDAKAGQLAGEGQPIKATGKLTADLPALLAQPVAAGLAALTRGTADVDFAASIGAKQELQARVALRQLAADPRLKLENLPAVTADVRADIAPDGKLTLNAPVAIERGERKSDLTLAGTLSPAKDGRTIEARVTSEQLVLDDAKLLAGVVAEKPVDSATPKPAAAPPPWNGLTGTVALQLKKVIYSEMFQATNVGGTLRFEGGALKLETVRAGLGEAGEAKLAGTVIYDASLPQPYALAADLAVTEFDPGPLFRAAAPDRPPTVEGRFNITSKLASRAATLGDLALGAGGDFHLTSRGGAFRGLPANVASLTETTGRIASFINTLGAMAGKKEYEDIANKAQAVAEFAKAIGNVSFDQLSVVVLRDTGLNTVLKDFTLISPELRLTGTGQTHHHPDTALLDDRLAMEFKLRARGRQADLLKYLGLIESQPDDFGYAACTLPLKIDGTLRRPEALELNQRLASIALEKSGLGEKASDLINRLRGNGK